MTTADKLEALETEMRNHIEKDGCACCRTPEWADRLAAIRAELGEAVPVAWACCSDKGLHTLCKDRATADMQAHGRIWHVQPLYTTPPATVPVEAVRVLADEWNTHAAGTQITDNCFRQGYGAACAQHSERLTALIAAQEKP